VWFHLGRAAELLDERSAAGPAARETERRDDLDAAWARLDALRRRVASVDDVPGARRRWPAVIVALVVTVAVAVVVAGPEGGAVTEVGRGRVDGRSLDEGPSVTIGAGERLVVHLGSAWHAPSVGLTVRHRLPCRVTLVRRGRPQWSTQLAGGEGSAPRRYQIDVPVRAQRRGYEQLVIAPDPADTDVEVGGLRLDPP
jgi:hypothetical protein